MNINLITNILGLFIALAGAANVYLTTNAGQPINWFNLIVAIGAAAVAYYTGKGEAK